MIHRFYKLIPQYFVSNDTNEFGINYILQCVTFVTVACAVPCCSAQKVAPYIDHSAVFILLLVL